MSVRTARAGHVYSGRAGPPLAEWGVLLVRSADYSRLGAAGPEDVQRAIDKWYPRSLDTFGKSDSRFSDLAVAYGIRRWGNAELRRMYKEDADGQIRGLGLTVPPEDRDRRIF